MREFFSSQLILVFFVYGLSFFTMGLAILLELGRPYWSKNDEETDFARALPPLAAFGLVHGSHEWLEMFLLINPVQGTTGLTPGANLLPVIRLALLGSSFLFLLGFGLQVSARLSGRKLIVPLASALALWLVGVGIIYQWAALFEDSHSAADVFTRYSLAIPGACLAAFGLFSQRQRLSKLASTKYGRDASIAALAFLVYGLIGQLFTSATNSIPCFFVSAECFLNAFGFPVQVLRAGMAILAAIFVIRLLRVFQFEKQTQVNAVSEAQQAEQKRLQELRAELLHRTVKAQEAERQRIARELHDETGQTLTAIGMGLRALGQNIVNDPRRAREQVQKLESLANSGVEELQRLVTGLHPASLDDLGLLPALRWMAGNATAHIALDVNVTSKGYANNLPLETRITLYRIAQEALANVIRHADASHASINLQQDQTSLQMSIQDDGRGFDPDEVFEPGNPIPSWGLLGMRERAALIGATMHLDSAPGEGTQVNIRLPIGNKGNGNSEQA